MSEMLKEKRATRGLRMADLVGEAAEQDVRAVPCVVCHKFAAWCEHVRSHMMYAAFSLCLILICGMWHVSCIDYTC